MGSVVYFLNLTSNTIKQRRSITTSAIYSSTRPDKTVGKGIGHIDQNADSLWLQLSINLISFVVFAGDVHRPYLTTRVKDKNDYINAAFLPVCIVGFLDVYVIPPNNVCNTFVCFFYSNSGSLWTRSFLQRHTVYHSRYTYLDH